MRSTWLPKAILQNLLPKHIIESQKHRIPYGETCYGKKDLISKKLEDYNDVFADIYNTLLFQSPTIIPAITIVLNMADQKWNAAKSLHELLSIDKQLAGYVQDYKIHVFDITFLDDKIINSFTSDFKEVAKFFKKKRLGLNPLDSRNKLSHPREIMEFISVFTQDTRYSDSVQYLENLEKGGGAATMCAVADALISEGIRKGRLEGKLEGKIELLYELGYSIEEICQKLDVPEGQVKNVLHL